jgi:RHS repeat-associated protein
VQVPANADTQTFTLQHTYEQAPGRPVSPRIVGPKKRLGTFYLNAHNAQGGEIRRFSNPLTMTVAYTPKQLQAAGISEADLTLFQYDDTQPDNAHWVPIDTRVDRTTHKITAFIINSGAFELADGSSPSATYLPSLQGWQVGLYQGDVSYQYPIDVPAGAAGIKPSLALSYNSASTDGKTGERPLQQAGWVGKGWSLDTGYVALNKLPGQGKHSRYYSLVFDGQSFELVRGAERTGIVCETGRSCPDVENPSHWEWHSTNESFIKVRAEGNGYSTSTRGATHTPEGRGPNGELPRFIWQVWTKSGIRYEFEKDMWQGFIGGCTDPFMEAYKWHLTRVEDTHGNRINYSYGLESELRSECGTGSTRVTGTMDGSIWPTEITWGGNATTADRYKVEFQSSWRTVDTSAESAGQLNPIPYDSHRLDAILVWSKQATTWEIVRRYNLCYPGSATPCPSSATSLLSDASIYDDNTGYFNPDSTSSKLTLTGIQRLSKYDLIAEAIPLPMTTFTYGQSRGTAHDPIPGWNRLTTVNNGQGGTITFGYQSISEYMRAENGDGWGTNLFLNNRRVVSKTITDGQGHSYVSTYSYPNSAYGVSAPPAYNSLGTDVEEDAGGPNANPNSAALYLNQMYDPENDHSGDLVVLKKREFRGHAYVIEHDPNGNETEHWFYQGNGFDTSGAACTPDLRRYGNDIYADACFESMRKHGFLKGKEYKTITHAGNISAAKLSEVAHTFSYVFISEGVDTYADDSYSGLWRAFSWESQTVQKAWEGAGSSLNKTTDYYYETTYGNLTQVNEIDNGTLARYTIYNYSTKDDPANYPNTYIVDRKRAERVFNGSTNLLAKSVYGYDGYTDGNTLGTKGDLTLQRKYYDITSSTPLTATVHSNDTTYGYDSNYGNQTTVTTYGGPGEAILNGTSYSAPGYSGGIQSASRTTTTTYDSTFHVFPIQVDPPTVNTSLAETATYDYRMGTLQSVTGSNGSTTTVNARYDVFGRMVKMWKPGDSETIPTLEATYYDNEVPFKYLVALQEVSGNPNLGRPITKFYDGLGREIQTKSESKDGIQNIVVDKLYDGLGNVTKQRLPRYVENVANDPSFWNYVTPSWTSADKTTTTYDALGRVLTVTEPDTTVTTMSYLLNTTDGRTVARTIDAKGHRTEHESDMLNRLIAVKEYNGTSTYTLDATTTYTYSPLDLLTQVTDAYGKNVTMAYDSLGRKSSMTDLAMGAWSYVYDVNGNLKTQTDARSQVITFNYDALNRLTSKNWPSYGTNPAESLLFKYDQTGTGYSYGKGQRTSTIRCTGVANTTCTGTGATQTSQVQWQYDTRGQTTSTIYTLAGLTGTRTMSQAYDSGGRVTSMTYPSGEAVSYTYDAAWRQKSAYSSTYSTYYANTATYTALDQPSSFALGNGLSQTYEYTTLMKRLSSIQVGTNGSILNRGYSYDNVGNVWHITGSPTMGTQTFTYDQRDRLTNWTATSISETYAYDLVGNITSKAGVSNTYTYTQAAGAGGPYALRNTGYTYDSNGNMTVMPNVGNGRTLVWNTENQPTSITTNGISETYTYDADNTRIKKVKGNTSTFYMGGAYEEDVLTGVSAHPTRYSYQFNGQVIAQRELNARQAVVWANQVRTNVVGGGGGSTGEGSTGNTLEKNSGGSDWNGGASSVQTITSGDGYIESIAVSRTYHTIFGLSVGDGGQGYDDIDFAIHLQGNQGWPGDLVIYEGGEEAFRIASIGETEAYAEGDVFRVAVEGEEIKYYKNGSVIYTSKYGPTYPLLFDGSLFHVGSQLKGAVIYRAGSNDLVYLHSDHLGSVGATTAASGTPTTALSRQEYDPWGKVRALPATGNSLGTVAQTKNNYTGQKLDDSGLLFYNARYYDPLVGRFTSADSIVPGASSGVGGAGGTVGAWQNSKLTVDFHEGTFLSSAHEENAVVLQKGFWFQLDNQDRGKADPSGPENPQALNRYSYVLNNPLRYIDRTGHWVDSWEWWGYRMAFSNSEVKQFLKELDSEAGQLALVATGTVLSSFVAGALTKLFGLKGLALSITADILSYLILKGYIGVLRQIAATNNEHLEIGISYLVGGVPWFSEAQDATPPKDWTKVRYIFRPSPSRKPGQPLGSSECPSVIPSCKYVTDPTCNDPYGTSCK